MQEAGDIRRGPRQNLPDGAIRSGKKRRRPIPPALVVLGVIVISCASYVLGFLGGTSGASSALRLPLVVTNDMASPAAIQHAPEERKEPQESSTLSRLLPASVAERFEPGVLFVNMAEHYGRRKHMEGLVRDIGFRPIPLNPACPDCNFWLGTLKSHRRALQRVASESHDRYVIILEDDADLAKDLDRNDFPAVLEEALRNLLQPADGFVYLGVCLDPKMWKVCTPRECSAHCTHAYMVTPPGAQKVLDSLTERYGVYDAQEVAAFDALLRDTISPPLLGWNYTHDHTFPMWRGLFYQARNAPWYSEKRRNNETRPG